MGGCGYNHGARCEQLDLNREDDTSLEKRIKEGRQNVFNSTHRDNLAFVSIRDIA